MMDQPKGIKQLKNDELARQIEALRKKHTNEVGFIPMKTLENRYIEKSRYIVILEGEHVVGYLLHGAMKAGKHVALTQVVSKDGYHVGLPLFRQFMRKAKECGCSGIRVRCAATLKARWDSLGFKLVETLDVDNTRRRKINIWYLEFS